MSSFQLRSLVWAILLSANLVQSAATPTQTQTQTQNALHPWVTVAPDGSTRTITPSVEGDSTISAFEGPTALPTALSDGSGAFLVCDDAAGSGGLYMPFCASAKDTEVSAGRTYFITWDVDYFEDPGRGIVVEGALSTNDGIVEGQAFTSGPLVASQGFYAWVISKEDPKSWNEMDVQLFLVYENGTSARNRISGPKVRVVPPEDDSSFQVSFVVLPASFILVALAVVATFVTVRSRGRRTAKKNAEWFGVKKDVEAKSARNSWSEGDFSWSAQDAEVAAPAPVLKVNALRLNPWKKIRSLGAASASTDRVTEA
ncbi:hypothetical protein ACHAQA_001580 [Verticillium albo-atrum]